MRFATYRPALFRFNSGSGTDNKPTKGETMSDKRYVVREAPMWFDGYPFIVWDNVSNTPVSGYSTFEIAEEAADDMNLECE